MTIDYLRCTQPKHKNFEVETFVYTRLKGFESPLGMTELPYGLSGYDTGYRLKYGKLFFHSSEIRMGVMYQLSGYELQKMREDGIEIQRMINHLCHTQVKFTRLDYCYDTQNKIATPDSFYRYCDEVNTQNREYSLIRSHKPSKREDKIYKSPADTAYLGSRKSDRFIRVYDKAKEQGLTDDTFWTRLEIQLNHARANAVAYASQKTPIEHLIASEIATMNNFDGLAWVGEMIGDKLYKASIDKTLPNIATYVEKSIIPYLTKNLWNLQEETVNLLIERVAIPLIKHHKGKISMANKQRLIDETKRIFQK